MSSIKLSPNHGVNPSMLFCPMCGADTGIALVGRIKGDAEAPRKMSDREPCKKCQDEITGYKELGFVLVVIDDRKDDYPDHTPWQFFHSLKVIKKEAVSEIFQDLDDSHGMAFITLSISRKIFPDKGE